MSDRQVRTCDECACGIVNDDWTHLDMDVLNDQLERDASEDGECDTDRKMASIQGTLEILGYQTLVGPSKGTGNFTCPICSDIQYGGGSLFSGVFS